CNREDSGSGSYGGDCGWYDDIENRYGDYKSHRRGDGQYRGIAGNEEFHDQRDASQDAFRKNERSDMGYIRRDLLFER
ncbi:unnamed protein product, partial [Didymodactylos carnosus]